MFRWNNISSVEIFDMTVKMYRNPFVPEKTIDSVFKNLEFDHYAYRYLGSELFMYRILDTNWDEYMEERGDVSRLDPVIIPTSQDFSQDRF